MVARRRFYDWRKTGKKCLKFAIFYGIGLVAGSVAGANEGICALIVGTILTALYDFIKHRRL